MRKFAERKRKLQKRESESEMTHFFISENC